MLFVLVPSRCGPSAGQIEIIVSLAGFAKSTISYFLCYPSFVSSTCRFATRLFPTLIVRPYRSYLGKSNAVAYHIHKHNFPLAVPEAM